LGKERFKEAGETPPRYASFAEALKRVSAAGDDLLRRKPAPPKPKEEPQTEVGSEAGGPQDPIGSGGETATSGPPVVVSAEPETADEATDIIAVAARILRRERPGDPAGYLLPRALRWGEVRAGGEHVDPRILEAPTTAQKTHLKTLFLDKKYDELLEAAEELMATPVGRGWLDLQRYAILSTEKLGQSHQQVSNALRSAVSSLLRDLPVLIEASLMDDSPTASRDTMSWLEAEGLLPGPEPEGRQEERSRAAEADRIIREAGFDRAAAMAQTGDPEGAVEMLMERAEHERSERDRFLAKTEAVRIMIDHDMSVVARPILDEIVSLIEKHQLEDWEPAEVVAKPIGLLIRCLDPESEASLRKELHPRLAKLDPLMAIQVGKKRSGGGSGSAGAPAPSGSETATEGGGEADG
jgi:type VI secretion system ImpA/VasJ family protein